MHSKKVVKLIPEPDRDRSLRGSLLLAKLHTCDVHKFLSLCCPSLPCSANEKRPLNNLFTELLSILKEEKQANLRKYKGFALQITNRKIISQERKHLAGVNLLKFFLKK